MSEAENHESGSTVTVSTSVFVLLLAATGFGGAGTYGVLGPQLQVEAITACFDNSQTALSVAAQHGEEFVAVRRRIEDNRSLILEKAADRYTGAKARDDWHNQEKVDSTQDRTLEMQERRIEALEAVIRSLQR